MTEEGDEEDRARFEALGEKTLDLLVLSACQTAQGDDRAALGLAGMAVRSGAKVPSAPSGQLTTAPPPNWF
jgi:CHAT domain-containing protein